MPPSIPTERELEALKVLWAMGEASVPRIHEALGGRGEELAYTTVLSLFQTMEQKGLVRRERKDGKAHVYVPCVTRARTFRQLAKKFLDRVFDGSLDEYIVHALPNRKISPQEWERIEELLEKMRAGRRSQGNTK